MTATLLLAIAALGLIVGASLFLGGFTLAWRAAV